VDTPSTIIGLNDVSAVILPDMPATTRQAVAADSGGSRFEGISRGVLAENVRKEVDDGRAHGLNHC